LAPYRETYSPQTLPSWLSLFVGLEQGAAQIQTYEAQFVPGLLQTRDYANTVQRRSTVERDDDEIERFAQLRQARQEVLDRTPKPLRLWVVLDEAALRRIVGSREIMRCQLEHLVTMAERPKITLQALPFAGGAHPGKTGPFQILRFPWPDDPGIIYLEHRGGALYLEEPHEIEAHTVAFEHLRTLALTPEESVTMIRDVAEEFAHD
jgi:hypothetical protein